MKVAVLCFIVPDIQQRRWNVWLACRPMVF